MTINHDPAGERPEGDPSQEHPAQEAHGGSMAPGLVDDTGRPIADGPPEGAGDNRNMSEVRSSVDLGPDQTPD